jgi:formylglycine-generating enzyme
MRVTGSLGLVPPMAAVLLALAACAEPFGPRANIHDLEGTWVVPASSLLPASGATTSDTTPLFDWDDVAGASGYEVQIATDQALLEPAAPVAAAESSYQVPLASVFAYGDQVFWRVRALDEQGVEGPWSDTCELAVAWSVDYGPPVPGDGSVVSDVAPLLDWADADGAGSYQVRIAAGEAGLDAAAVAEASASTYRVPAGLAPGAWYWQVRAVNVDGVPGGWSAAWSFAVPLLRQVSVVGGLFSMGSTAWTNEQPVHAVTLSSFFIGAYEVTQAQYAAVMGSNPSSFTGDELLPVESVTWYDAVAFCNALSSFEGLDPCYVVEGIAVSADFTRTGYRLPTEAEWEYAARGGAASQGYTYSGSDTPDAVAWYDANSSGGTMPVGTKAANELGIHDMSGNAWEWCWDWYGSYGAGAQADPTGAASGTTRIARGGSYFTGIDFLRCADRDYLDPAASYDNIGFRVARRAG